ncbi:uncharacterized protein LOC129972691 [Argiope bruennichi]|uniref:Protein PIH1D3 like protein n=1 Tax=Argiope bruennichi TaxID=94029 RepID=A0A8T0F686_ARGBR|nr:uncharacterized protein LOC129972691 [Argiope bruennichi]KAF8786704.1 Protein PIH1D3 like protein [Argiope bruennichi]
MEDFQTSDIRQLVNLLTFEEDNDSDIDNSDYLSTKKRSIYSEKMNKNMENNSTNQTEIDNKPNYYSKLDKSKNIWEDDEVPDEDYDEIQMKEEPKYDMIYQQNVTPDDMFLQLDGKGPGSNNCECLLIKIKLEDVNSSDEITLKISNVSVICKTNKYYLDLNLPKHVDPEKCSAKWNQSSRILDVKLLLDDKELFL